MKSLVEEEAVSEVKGRLEALDRGREAKWGKLSVTEMLAHCQRGLEVPLGMRELKRPNIFLRTLMKLVKPSMYNETRWRKNLPTLPEFRVDSYGDFEQEREKLNALIDEFRSRQGGEWPDHPVLGDFSEEQWGKLQYKHLDHHLRQFGA